MIEKHFKETKQNINANIQSALEEIGKVGVAESQIRTPVKTGNLRRSIGYSVAKDEVNIGTNVDYAEIVHEGSSRQKSQPFIKNGIMQNINKIKEIIAKWLKEVGV